MPEKEKICVVGLGYIGLPTACLFATHGYRVIGIDINKEKIETINGGNCPFEEPGMAELLKKVIRNKNLFAKTEIEPANIFIIAVQTPLEEKYKKPNLNFVISATRKVQKVLSSGNLVILESTVPPQTTREILIPILGKSGLKAGKDFSVSHCPERAMPGLTLKEMIWNYRIIGGLDEKSAMRTKKLYSSFVKGKIFLTDLTTAEVVKLMENTYRDINIAMANEFAKIAPRINIDIWEAIKLANFHPRVKIHLPGPGVGGHCIPKDPWFLIDGSHSKTQIIRLARKINDSMPDYVVSEVNKFLKNIKKPIVTILGVAYKANVDDWRETPALRIIKLVQKKGWQVKIHDPLVKDFPYKLEKDFKKATENSDCLLLLTGHDFYKNINPTEIKNMRNKNIFDTRHCINKNKWKKIDFKVKVLGRNEP